MKIKVEIIDNKYICSTIPSTVEGIGLTMDDAINNCVDKFEKYTKSILNDLYKMREIGTDYNETLNRFLTKANSLLNFNK